ncbi:acylneuraminate cytidylyltransferase family protein [Oleiharenicola lentus]|uniref:Acylneuraminate cytidylyltransferase family protein n=1 Tax=Oleiharenicola lentus TaxID=2508720 RepID=A0A4Q1CA24_9BACT|nr:acylneuraminate cytidylyltransferase family protein [Oleiharenicola lentus]RXK55716.1 acylneuraminate cytidylyltransferase family protein [Oleiharenicola lentus]
MKILALIPARGGSKRLPGKNTRLLGGKPMIAWSIEAAKGIGEICAVLISTDDPQIAAVAKAAGGQVPWLRPAELATDTATSVDVALHALDWYENAHGKVDGLLLLQPTSPFRTPRTIRQGIGLFSDNPQFPVLGVARLHVHPEWALRLEGGRLVRYTPGNGLETRSQDLPQVFFPTGSLYVIAPEVLRTGRTFVGAQAVPVVIEPPHEALDIDTEWDFRIAEMVASNPQDYRSIED